MKVWKQIAFNNSTKTFLSKSLSSVLYICQRILATWINFINCLYLWFIYVFIDLGFHQSTNWDMCMSSSSFCKYAKYSISDRNPILINSLFSNIVHFHYWLNTPNINFLMNSHDFNFYIFYQNIFCLFKCILHSNV